MLPYDLKKKQKGKIIHGKNLIWEFMRKNIFLSAFIPQTENDQCIPGKMVILQLSDVILYVVKKSTRSDVLPGSFIWL